jgi:hypothetical protein
MKEPAATTPMEMSGNTHPVEGKPRSKLSEATKGGKRRTNHNRKGTYDREESYQDYSHFAKRESKWMLQLRLCCEAG